MAEEKDPATGTQSPAASPSRPPAPPARTTASQPSSLATPTPAPPVELMAGQTGPSIPKDPGVAPDGTVVDPDRVKAAQEERAAYMHGSPPDDHPFSEGRTVGDIRKAQEPEVDTTRRVVAFEDEASDLSGHVHHVTETIES
jgi:hypothetical protein